MTRYRNTAIDGLNVFYREAGRKDAPTIVLLHGFPSSSHMFRDLIPQLADHFHLIAPDPHRLWLQRRAVGYRVQVHL